MQGFEPASPGKRYQIAVTIVTASNLLPIITINRIFLWFSTQCAWRQCERPSGLVFFQIHVTAWNKCSSSVTCCTRGMTPPKELTVLTVPLRPISIKTRPTLMPCVALPPFNCDYICCGCSACHSCNYSTVPFIKTEMEHCVLKPNIDLFDFFFFPTHFSLDLGSLLSQGEKPKTREN